MGPLFYKFAPPRFLDLLGGVSQNMSGHVVSAEAARLTFVGEVARRDFKQDLKHSLKDYLGLDRYGSSLRKSRRRLVFSFILCTDNYALLILNYIFGQKNELKIEVKYFKISGG